MTSVTRLNDEDRVSEIARMMGGAAAGEKALESARELLNTSETKAKGESERRKGPRITRISRKTQDPGPKTQVRKQ